MFTVTPEDRHFVTERLKSAPIGLLDPARPLLVERGWCPTCSKVVSMFRDELSLREYRISGLCQTCQDALFGFDLEGPMEVPTDPSTFE